jgi:hypothetical protein
MNVLIQFGGTILLCIAARIIAERRARRAETGTVYMVRPKKAKELETRKSDDRPALPVGRWKDR